MTELKDDPSLIHEFLPVVDRVLRVAVQRGLLPDTVASLTMGSAMRLLVAAYGKDEAIKLARQCIDGVEAVGETRQ